MISHGAARFLKERTMDVSDKYRVHICQLCGLFCEAQLKNGIFKCRCCESNSKIVQVQMPYASKLLFQELMALMITPRLITSTMRR
jgi:DNA-directed RNA polymerase II subunit RPB2